MSEDQKKNTDTGSRLTEEQLKENQAKLEEYERILKVTVVAVALMFAVIVCIVFGLIINGN
jgi:cell division protein FtsL